MKNYIEFVFDGIGQVSIMEEVKAQSMLGTDDFIAEFEDYLAGIWNTPEVIKDQRMLKRPLLKAIFYKVGKKNKIKRNRLI